MNSIELYSVSVLKQNRRILNSLTFDFPKGAAIGLLGPSGSGKTTLMRSIAGLQKLNSGEIKVLSITAGSKPLRTKISYSTQSASLYNDLTCLENLNFYSSLYPENQIPIADILEMVELTKVRKQLARTLSGGERTRLALATALVGNPELVILDEPTVGLDPVLRKDLWEIFKKLVKTGKTLLISSHVMDEAENCDYIYLMREGEIIANGTTDDLKKRTNQHDMENVFISLVNS
jgi:ABC-2 type transport system ATP-binding protein